MKAIISGVAIEAMLLSVLFAIGWGPCGPGSPIGYVLLLLHYPGIWVLETAAHFHLPTGMEMPIIFGSGAGIWSVLIYAAMRWRHRRQWA
ncbi:MAG TPA: hypothetical protein VGE39_06100 [Prosthecobacter sp.]